MPQYLPPLTKDPTALPPKNTLIGRDMGSFSPEVRRGARRKGSSQGRKKEIPFKKPPQQDWSFWISFPPKGSMLHGTELSSGQWGGSDPDRFSTPSGLLIFFRKADSHDCLGQNSYKRAFTPLQTYSEASNVVVATKILCIWPSKDHKNIIR